MLAHRQPPPRQGSETLIPPGPGFGDRESQGVEFAFKDNVLTLETRSPDTGRSKVQLAIEYSGEPVKLRILIPFLLAHHEKHGTKPLTVTEIAESLTKDVGAGWSQPSVSRAMGLLFPEGGMAHYERLCLSGAILKKGILKRYADGTADIDAIVEDDDQDD